MNSRAKRRDGVASTILCVGATPAEQRVMVFSQLTEDAVNRAALTLDGAAGKSVNVAKVLKALGEHPYATGFLGGDRGRRIRSRLDHQRIQHEFVDVPSHTRLCITVIDQYAGSQTELVEESLPVPSRCYSELFRVVRKRLPVSRAIILSGTLTQGGPADFYFRCVRESNQVGILSVVDAKGESLDRALDAHPSLVKPNRSELEASVGRKLKSERALRKAMQELVDRGAGSVVVTGGAEATLAFDGTSFWRIHPVRLKAVNPIGSGDSFTAALVSSLLRGEDLGEACRWGTAAGGANTLSLMPGELTLKKVREIGPLIHVERL